jgi:hypothetical protein
MGPVQQRWSTGRSTNYHAYDRASSRSFRKNGFDAFANAYMLKRDNWRLFILNRSDLDETQNR